MQSIPFIPLRDKRTNKQTGKKKKRKIQSHHHPTRRLYTTHTTATATTAEPSQAKLCNKVNRLIETLHQRLLARRAHPDPARPHLAQAEHALDDAQLGGGGVEPRDGEPVVDDHARADDGAAAVDAARDEGHLQQGGELVLVADGGFWVDDAALVGEGHVRAREDVVGDRLPEDFDAEDVGDSIPREIGQSAFLFSPEREGLPFGEMGMTYISSVSRSRSGCTSAT